MGTQYGFIPSYILKGSIGKQIAKLKGMEEGWFYPTFILNFITNPSSLLLNDKIYYDEVAVKEAYRYILTQAGSDELDDLIVTEIINSENPLIDKIIKSANKEISSKIIAKIKILKDLLSSEIFIPVNVESKLNQNDVPIISAKYKADYNNVAYSNIVDDLVSKYGSDYSRPSPYLFEAMNINVLQIVTNRLKSSLIDDSVRAPLYRYKLINSLKEKMTAVEEFVDNLPQVIYGLPSFEIKHVDEFLSFHQSKTLQDFRNHINIISDSKSELSSVKVKKELYDANRSLLESKYDKLTLVGSVISTYASALTLGLSILDPFTFTANCATFASSFIIAKQQIDEYWKIKDLKWFSFLKGLAESQI